jgi:hypothetical protein
VFDSRGGRGKAFSLLHNVHIDSDAHSASYETDIGGLFPWDKATGA